MLPPWLTVTDKDLREFTLYAARELQLDRSLAAAIKYGRGEEHKKSCDSLRDLNLKMLLRDTRKGIA